MSDDMVSVPRSFMEENNKAAIQCGVLYQLADILAMALHSGNVEEGLKALTEYERIRGYVNYERNWTVSGR